MKVRFRKYCYDCRRNAGFFCRRRGVHVLFWEYYIHHNGVRISSSGPFRTYDRAMKSAERKWAKLVKAGIITDDILSGKTQH